MRRTSLTLIFVAFLALYGAAATPAAHTPSDPVLWAVPGEPVVVRGAHFRPLERVRVRLIVDRGSYFRRVRASRLGAFAVAFHGVKLDRCEGVQAFATGAQGSRAASKRVFPLCPAPLAPAS